MAFRYGQNYNPVHIYDEMQHIDIEAYKYTLKLQIYISNSLCTDTDVPPPSEKIGRRDVRKSPSLIVFRYTFA